MGDGHYRRDAAEQKPVESEYGRNLGIPSAAAIDDAYFISEHRWEYGLSTEKVRSERIIILNQGDDSTIPVPAVFMFVPGIPVVVNHNTYQSLRATNGGDSGLGVPETSDLIGVGATKEFHLVGMPAGAILLTPISINIQCQRKRPWQQNDVSRKGLLYAAALACTDYKVQGRTPERVALELREARTTDKGRRQSRSLTMRPVQHVAVTVALSDT